MLKKSKKLGSKKQQRKRKPPKPQPKKDQKESPKYSEETLLSLGKLTSEEDIVSRLYAWEGLYKHITTQIRISKESPDRYRRREMIRLQIALGHMEKLLNEGKKAAMDFDE